MKRRLPQLPGQMPIIQAFKPRGESGDLNINANGQSVQGGCYSATSLQQKAIPRLCDIACGPSVDFKVVSVQTAAVCESPPFLTLGLLILPEDFFARFAKARSINFKISTFKGLEGTFV